MKKLTAVILSVLFSMAFYINALAEINIPETVRVGLFYSSTALSTVTISSNYDVKCSAAEELTGLRFEVKPKDGGFIINDEYAESNSTLELYPTDGFINVNSKPYRGYIRLINYSDKITVVNIVKTEDYLYGVLPLEMATGWPIEALKSQAVCARNYVASSIGDYGRYGFDVTNNTYSQMYGGVSVEKEDCTKAVDETRGIAVTYNNKLACTYYFATSAGVTLNVEDVWGSTNYPYLKSVDDSIQNNVISNNGAWKVNYTVDEINELIINKNLGIGKIVDVKLDRNEQGAVVKLYLIGTDGTKTYERENTRNFFNLKSQTYDIEKSFDGTDLKIISLSGKENSLSEISAISDSSSTKLTEFKVLTANGTETVKMGTSLNNVLIKGVGVGHGIGLCQNGAKAMAMAGFTYEEILKHYFTGVELQKIY